MIILRSFLKHEQLLKGKAAKWDPVTKTYFEAGNILPEVVALMKKAHIFVIEEEPINTLFTKKTGLPLAPPFKICWFESLVGKNGLLPLSFVLDKDLNPVGRQVTASIGILLHELEPGIYDMFVLEVQGRLVKPIDVPIDFTAPTSGASTSIARVKSDNSVIPMGSDIAVYRSIDSYTLLDNAKVPPPLLIIDKWLTLVNSGVMAVEETKDNVVLLPRPERPHKKHVHQINQIVRIVPKRLKGKVVPLTPHGVIDWSHRWEVRGHWRKVKGIGKDRAGEYVVHQNTWVSDFVKGPKGKPLIKKSRVMLT